MTKADMKADPVDYHLALVRAATAPPRAAKARVRGALAHTLPAARPAPSGAARRSAAWKGLGLLGAGLVAGYWLGLGRVGMPADAGAPIAPAAPIAGIAEHPTPKAVSLPADGEDPASSQASAPHGEPTNGSADGSIDASAHVGTPAPRARAETQSARARPDGAVRSQPASVAELMLLSRAERAIRASDGRLALAFITELEQEHPGTRFAEERQALRVLAECLLREPQAPARAVAFLEARTTSVYSDRVQRLCLTESAPPFGAASTDGSGQGAH
jgi:hypothetical protein